MKHMNKEIYHIEKISETYPVKYQTRNRQQSFRHNKNPNGDETFQNLFQTLWKQRESPD